MFLMQFFISLIALAVLIPIAIAGSSLAPWVPAKRKDLSRIDELLNLQEGSLFFELGSGDGRVSRYIAKQNPHATIVGIEMALPLYLIAKLRQAISPVENLSFVWGNALKQDLSQADVIYTYAMVHTINTKLKKKFLSSLKPGCKIVSYHFAMTDWPGEQTMHRSHDKEAKIHVYEIPSSREKN